MPRGGSRGANVIGVRDLSEMVKQCDLSSSLVGASLIITQKVKRKRLSLKGRIGDPIHLSTSI